MKIMKYGLAVSIGAVLMQSTGAIAASKEHNLTDQIIVKFSDQFVSGSRKAIGLSKQINKKLVYVKSTSLGAHVYKLPSMESLPQVKGYATALAATSGVKHAEADQMMFAVSDLATPPNEGVASGNQPVYDLQWHYHEAAGGMNIEGAWAQLNSTDGSVNVAVLDTGITNHPDLMSNVLGGKDMISGTFVSNDGDGRDSDPSDPGDWVAQGACGNGYPRQDEDSSWHGTHVSGTISAVTNNGSGVAGVGYNLLNVVPVRVLGRCGGYLSDISDGIVWAATGSDNSHKARVINMSLGGSGSCSSTYQLAINTAVAAGATVVVSAGNSNTDAAGFQPANCSNVVSVAATGRTGARAYYSNYGDSVDLAAPGGDMSTGSANGVLSTLNTGTTVPVSSTYAYYQGTSMAAPHVSAVAGLMYLKDSGVTPAEVEAILKASARAFPANCSQCGSGILDAGAALSALGGVLPPPEPEPTTPSAPTGFAVTSVSGSGTANLSWNDVSDDEAGFYIEKRQKNRRRWSGFAAVTTTSSNVGFYDESGLDGVYEYRVRSFNSAGNSSWVIAPQIEVTSGSDGGGSGSCKGGWKKCGN